MEEGQAGDIGVGFEARYVTKKWWLNNMGEVH